MHTALCLFSIHAPGSTGRYYRIPWGDLACIFPCHSYFSHSRSSGKGTAGHAIANEGLMRDQEQAPRAKVLGLRHTTRIWWTQCDWKDWFLRQRSILLPLMRLVMEVLRSVAPGPADTKVLHYGRLLLSQCLMLAGEWLVWRKMITLLSQLWQSNSGLSHHWTRVGVH